MVGGIKGNVIRSVESITPEGEGSLSGRDATLIIDAGGETTPIVTTLVMFLDTEGGLGGGTIGGGTS